MVEGLGDLDLTGSFSVKNLVKEVPGAAGEFVNDNQWAIVGAMAPLTLLAFPHSVYGAESLQTDVGSTEKIGGLVKTLALPLILGAGNAYRAWSAVGKDIESLQEQIDSNIVEANAMAGISSAEDLVWQIMAEKFGLDPDVPPDGREEYYSRVKEETLTQIKDLAEKEFPELDKTFAKLTSTIKELSKKRNKIRRRGALQVPFEFGQGFLVGCFGMALLQPDGAPAMVNKFIDSPDLIEKTENGLYLSGYVYASWTATMEAWKLQHAAGSRGRMADEAKANQKRMREDAGEDVAKDRRPKLNDKAKAMTGDPVAKVKVKMSGSK